MPHLSAHGVGTDSPRQRYVLSFPARMVELKPIFTAVKNGFVGGFDS